MLVGKRPPALELGDETVANPLCVVSHPVERSERGVRNADKGGFVVVGIPHSAFRIQSAPAVTKGGAPMSDLLRITILCDMPMFALGVRQALEDGSRPFRTLAGKDLVAGAAPGDTDVLLVIPRDWREMRAWRRPLK